MSGRKRAKGGEGKANRMTEAELLYLRERVGQLESVAAENARLLIRVAQLEAREQAPGRRAVGTADENPGALRPEEKAGRGIANSSVARGREGAATIEQKVNVAQSVTLESPDSETKRILIFGPGRSENDNWKYMALRELNDLLLGMPDKVELLFVSGTMSSPFRPKLKRMLARFRARVLEAHQDGDAAYRGLASEVARKYSPDLMIAFHTPVDVLSQVLNAGSSARLAVCATHGSPVSACMSSDAGAPTRSLALAVLNRADAILVNSARVRNQILELAPDAGEKLETWLRGTRLSWPLLKDAKNASRTRAAVLVELGTADEMAGAGDIQSALAGVEGLDARIIEQGDRNSGRVAGTEIAAFLDGTDVLISLPMSSAFPQFAMDALAMGIPCVVPRSSLSLLEDNKGDLPLYADTASCEDQVRRIQLDSAAYVDACTQSRTFASKHLTKTHWAELLQRRLAPLINRLAQ